MTAPIKNSSNRPVQPLVPLSDPVSPIRLEACGKSFDISELSEFSFLFYHPGTVTSDVQNGTLHGEGLEDLPIRFRPRNVKDKAAIKCSFVDLTLKDKNQLAEFVQLAGGSNRKGDQLEGMSYDDIAGAKSTPTKKGEIKVKSSSAKGSRSAKIATMLFAMLAAVVIGAIIVAGIVKSKGSIPMVNSTLVGNYLAIESLSAGVIDELDVVTGQEVSEGQVLFYVEAAEDIREAQERSHELAELEAQMQVYKNHVALSQKNLEESTVTMAADYEAIDALIEQASLAVKFAQNHERKLQDLMKEDIIGVSRVNEASIKTAQARLELENYSNERRQLRERLMAAKEGRFVADETTQIQRQQSELALGLAKAKRDALLARQNEHKSRVPVHAPISGKVSSVYQEAGTYVKAGETVIAITRNDNTWAVGHVLAKDAPKVKPGQTVTVRVPSMKASYTGEITGVGHRSVYSQGDWSSDFRTSVPSSTPIKVDIPEIENLPSGLRMEMTIKLDDVWPWESWLEERRNNDQKAEGKPAFAEVSSK